MDYKKSAFMLILTLFVLFTIAGAYAGDVNDATMAVTDTDNLGISEDAQLTEPANDFADAKDAINVSSSLNEIQEDDPGAAETYESKSADKEILSAGEGNVQGSKVITVEGSSFEDIEDAIKSASDGDIIKLSNITYRWSGDEITISKQITIDGNDAVLYAKEKGRIFYVTGKNVVFNNVGFYGGSRLEGGAICFSDSSSNCIVSNCGFTQNHATYGSAIYDEGRNNCVLNCSIYENIGEYGAIRSKGFNMTISGCVFVENEGTTGAGAVFLAGSHETVVNCEFYQNFAKKYGGAVMLNYNSVNCSVINSTFLSNYVKYAEAGAISDTGSGNIIYNCHFQSNYAEEDESFGAAIELGGKNLQISYCNFTSHNADYGAAVYLNDKAYNCTVSNSLFYYNAVIYDGAAIYDNGSNNKILTSKFYQNDAASGSVYLSGSNATIDACVFSENIGQYGGAVYLNDKAYNCTVSNSSFSNNGATKGGAAIYDKGSDNKILTSEFSENQAASGSVYLSGINAITDGCVFSENTCLYGAAIMLNESSSGSLISNSKFYNNTANLGAIYNEGQSRITNSIFDNNSADFGGAVYNYDELEIVNCDFSSNWANRGVENGTTVTGINASSNCGGAILNYGYLKLSRSTFKDNHALILGGSICNLATLDLENSIFEKNHAIYAGAILNLFNMTVTGCNFTENTAIKTGAIINQGFGMIVKSIFKANSAMADGGAVSNYENSTLTVIDSTLENNHAQTYGGAISNHGVFDVKNTGFKNNYVNVGGAIINYATFNIEKCTFENNNATDNGGAVFSNEGTLTVTDSNFTANGAKIGGAINTQNCTFVISNSRLTNNRAESVGGAIVCFAGDKASANIVNVTVDNNSAATYGGGIYSTKCDLTISDSRLSNNRVSGTGGAIYSNNGKVVLKNSILESNSAKYASAIYILKGNESSFTNSVVAKNTVTDGGTVISKESDLKIMNSTFCENTALTASAIWTDNGDSLKIASHTIFIDNTDNMNSIRADKGSVNTSKCEFLYTISFEIAHIDDVVAKSPITIGVVAKMINGHKFNGYVTVNIGSESYKVQIVNGSGKLKVTPNFACGKYKAKINFNSSDFVPTSAQSNEFEILKRPANIKISKIADFVKGSSVTVTVSADSYFSGNLTVSIGGENYVVNVVKGSGSQKISPALALGTYTAEIKFAGDNVFAAQNVSSNKFKVTKIPTTVSASAVTSVYKDGKNLVATLMDGSKKPIKGVKVTIKLSNGKSYNRTTDKNGQVKLSVSSLVPKTYYATISFAGNANYTSSSKKVKVTVKKLPTKIVPSKITFKKKETKKVSMILKDKNNKVLKGKTVSFVFQKKTYKVKTNSKGVATYTFAKINSGTYALTFKFAGDSYYSAVSKSVKVVVKK